MGTQIVEREAVGSFFGERLVASIVAIGYRKGDTGWWVNDLARRRKINPLGLFVRFAVNALRAGYSYAKVTAPLHETLAFLRMVAGIAPKPLCEALREAQKESGEAASARVALCMAQMSRSELESYIKETEEEIEAATASVESARAALLGMDR